MNKFQQAQYDSSLRVKDFITLYDTLLNTNPEFVLLMVIFSDLLGKIEIAHLKQASDITIYSPDKKLLKLMMAITVIKYAKLGAAKAYLIKNIELLAALDKAISYILTADDDTASARATDLKQVMKDNLGILTNLQIADIDEMTLAISAFVEKKPVPIEKIKEKKSEGTDPIPGFLSEIEDCKKQMGNIIHSAFPALANTWDDFAKIGVPAGKKLSVSVQYLDEATMTRLRNVVVTFVNNTETIVKKSSKIGFVRGYDLEEGNWTITAVMKGYEPNVQKDVAIISGVILRIVVKLKKVGGGNL